MPTNPSNEKFTEPGSDPGQSQVREGSCLKDMAWLVSVILPQEKQEELQLKEEYDKSLQEVKMTEMQKQEEYQPQQKCEKCHQVGGKNEAEVPGILKAPSTG